MSAEEKLKNTQRKIISKALDWKSSKKNNYNIKLGFLFHINAQRKASELIKRERNTTDVSFLM
jgi:hypothetical protein